MERPKTMTPKREHLFRELYGTAVHVLDNAGDIYEGGVANEEGFFVSREDFLELNLAVQLLRVELSGARKGRFPVEVK